jgi:hypothetical protein
MTEWLGKNCYEVVLQSRSLQGSQGCYAQFVFTNNETFLMSTMKLFAGLYLPINKKDNYNLLIWGAH